MIKNLKKIKKEIYHYKEGLKIIGVHSNISGNVLYIRGDVSNIRGDVSDIRGNVSNIIGNVSNISGDVDECEISQQDLIKGKINVSLLII